MPNWLETIDNGIVFSSLSFQNLVGSFVSTDHDKSLNKNNQIEEDNYYQDLVADGKVIVISRHVQLYDLILLFLVDNTYYFLVLFS